MPMDWGAGLMKPIPTILIVEDNQNDVEFLRERFARARMINPRRVVRDGAEAIQYLSGEGKYADRQVYPLPGIVLLDLAMPKMDGFEVLDWIRARKEFDQMPVIVLTGFSSDPLIQRAQGAGADGYLIKGVDTEGLLHLLTNAFLGWALVPVPQHSTQEAGGPSA